MPTRIFTALDATTDEFTLNSNVNAVESGISGATRALLSTILTQTGVGSWEMNPNLNGTSPNGTATVKINADPGFGGGNAIVQEWTVDYTNFPAIPEIARIKKLTFRRPRSVNYVLSGTIPGSAFSFVFYSNPAADPIYFGFISTGGIPSDSMIESFAGVAADEVLFDHTGTEDFVTRDELIALWSEFNNNLYGIGVTAEGDDSPNPATASIVGSLTFGQGWQVIVEYEESYEFLVSQANAPFNEGDTVNITSPVNGTNPLDMEQITDIDIVYPDPDNPGSYITVPVTIFSATNENTLTFVIPPFGGGNTPTTFAVVVTSTQFSGTLELSQLYTVYFISASGLYILDVNQTHDTLYIEEDLPNTINVKIPNPFIKTGFIDG